MHHYVRLDDDLIVASYGYASIDISRLAGLLLDVADAMRHFEDVGADIPTLRSTMTWENAATLEWHLPACHPAMTAPRVRQRRPLRAAVRGYGRALAWVRGLRAAGRAQMAQGNGQPVRENQRIIRDEGA